jgi:hypothetical protein
VFRFEYDDFNDWYTIYASNQELEGDIVIPSEHDGLPVREIGDGAFSGCQKITSVTISDGIDEIGSGAFSGCQKIISVTIPDSVEIIRKDAFANCINLQKIKMSQNIRLVSQNAFYNTKYYNDNNNWAEGLLYIDRCLIDVDTDTINGKKKIAVKKGTTVIASGAFMKANVVRVELPSSLKHINTASFDSVNIDKLIINGKPIIYDFAFRNAHMSFLTLSAKQIYHTAFDKAYILELYLESIDEVSASAFSSADVRRFRDSDIDIYIEKFRDSIFSSKTKIVNEHGYLITSLQITKEIRFPVFENLKIENIILGNNMSNSVFSNAEINNLLIANKDIRFSGDEVFKGASVNNVYFQINSNVYTFPEITNDLLNEINSII